MAAQTRRAFLGGNTPLGFFSYFDHLIRPGRAQRLYIIKGGPGTGKSSFMKSVAEAFLESGYDIEAFHCSSDPESLDAVRIPAIEVAWLDGTAPHTIDPAFPGIFDEIVDFGACLDPTVLLHQKREVLQIQAEVRHGYQQAYRYLAAAKSIHENIVAANTAAMNHGPLNERIQQVVASIFGHRTPSKVTGHARRLFASAITPAGLVHFLPSLMDPVPKRIVVTGEPGTGKSTLLKAVAQTAIAQGFDLEIFHSPLDPHAIDHVIIPKLGVAVITSTEAHPYTHPDATLVNLNEYRDYHKVQRHRSETEDAMALYRQVLEQAVRTLAQTKAVRDELEGYYVEAMDFSQIEAIRRTHLERHCRPR